MDESDSNMSRENHKLKKYIEHDYNLHIKNSQTKSYACIQAHVKIYTAPKDSLQASEMAQWVPAAKPQDLSATPGAPIVEGEPTRAGCPLTFTVGCSKYTCIHK